LEIAFDHWFKQVYLHVNQPMINICWNLDF